MGVCVCVFSYTFPVHLLHDFVINRRWAMCLIAMNFRMIEQFSVWANDKVFQFSFSYSVFRTLYYFVHVIFFSIMSFVSQCHHNIVYFGFFFSCFLCFFTFFSKKIKHAKLKRKNSFVAYTYLIVFSIFFLLFILSLFATTKKKKKTVILSFLIIKYLVWFSVRFNKMV